MIYSLSNGKYSARVDSVGAELLSITDHEGNERLWQGNPEIWDGHAPNLFPFCGRLYGSKYRYGLREYEMPLHGFLRSSETECVLSTPESLFLRLVSNQETKKVYPFDFMLNISFQFSNRGIICSSTLKNTGSKDMVFSFGAHPGICVPFPNGSQNFEDYSIDFGVGYNPKHMLIGEDGLDSGMSEDYPLRNERYLDLNREVFSEEMFFSGLGNEVSIIDRTTGQKASAFSDKARFWGIWQPYGKNAPFVCVEPWTGFPGRSGLIENLKTKLYTDICEPWKVYAFSWSLEFD